MTDDDKIWLIAEAICDFASDGVTEPGDWYGEAKVAFEVMSSFNI